MTALLIDPHGDDAALFACFTAIRERPVILVPQRTVPKDEVMRAMSVMGCGWLENTLKVRKVDVTHVYAPAIHEDGHEQHNEWGEWALDNLSSVPITWYSTYAPRAVRQGGTEVIPDESWWYACKLRALSCFVSQIEQESTRPWFTSLLDLREWYA